MIESWDLLLLVSMCLLSFNCVAYEVEISHSEFLQSIEFFKDGNILPDFLLEYDYSDFVDNVGIGDKMLRASTGNAYFDTVVFKKKKEKQDIEVGGSDVDDHTGMIRVFDKQSNEVWMGTFGTFGDDTIIMLDKDFITAPPLESVEIIDTMQ
jgi:hypothetical protein